MAGHRSDLLILRRTGEYHELVPLAVDALIGCFRRLGFQYWNP